MNVKFGRSIALGLVIIVTAFGIFISSTREDKIVASTTNSFKSSTVKLKDSALYLPSKQKPTVQRQIAASKVFLNKITIKGSPLDEKPRTLLRNTNDNLFLVHDVFASNFDKLPLKKIESNSGINYYEIPKDGVPSGGLQVVYNSKTKEYGMLSGEIIIARGYKRAKAFVEENGITITWDDRKSQSLIIREDNLEKLQDILGHPDLEKSRLRLDVIYYLNVPK